MITVEGGCSGGSSGVMWAMPVPITVKVSEQKVGSQRWFVDPFLQKEDKKNNVELIYLSGENYIY